MGELRVGRVGAPVGYSRDENPGDRGLEEGNMVMAINADGTCLTKVFSDPDMTLYGAAWQPGIGREAGPMSC